MRLVDDSDRHVLLSLVGVLLLVRATLFLRCRLGDSVLLPLNKLQQSPLVEVPSLVVVGAVDSRLVQGLLDLVDVEVELLARYVNILGDAHELFELLWGAEVGDKLRHAFTDQRKGVGERATIEDLFGYL